MGFKSQFKSQFKEQFKGQFSGGGIPNPLGAVANYLFKVRQDLIDNVSGILSASVSPSAVFNSNGLELDASYTASIDSSTFPVSDFRLTIPFVYDSFSSQNSPRLIDSTTDGNNITDIFYLKSSSQWVFSVEIGGSTSFMLSNVHVPVMGESISIAVEISSTLGARIALNGSYSAYDASVTSCVWNATSRLMNRQSDGNRNINGDLSQVVIENI